MRAARLAAGSGHPPCSHDEGAALRSIHVSGEGEGSKATLISWLKRQAAQRFGQHVVGQHAWVCWPTEAAFYKGLILTFSPETGKHKVSAPLCLGQQLHTELPPQSLHPQAG